MITPYKNILCCFFLAAFFLSACSKIHFIEFDPVYVRANAKGANVYRASYEKLTDIIHTNLDVSFNWDSTFVYGNAEITARPYFYPTDEIILDAKGFKINEIKLLLKNHAQVLPYTYENQKLKIKLDKVYQKEEQFTVAIDYVAMPQKLKVGKDIFSPDDRGLYFINPKGKGRKPQQIWTQGETENNSAWFPTIENPSEKMTHHFNITVDERFKTLSNGLLKKSVTHKDGTRTDFWEMNQPHAIYLSMLAVGDFAITKDHWNGKEVNYYTEHKYASSAKKVFGNTPEMMSFFSDILKYPYPWESYNQIVVRDFVSGAMENTTASVFYDRLNLTQEQHEDDNQDDIIAHELFHHWFGNLVTCESWSNLTLNEAFATYAEYLWREYKNGKGDADHHLMQDARSYFNQAKNRDEKVIRFDYADKEQMFDAISYAKGGLILHTLRQEVGDEAFFASLNVYLTSNAYQSAEIHDLRLAFEEVTGKDLNWFFNQWFLASGYPHLTIDKIYDEVNQQMVFKIAQVQDSLKVPVYRLPLQLNILTDTGLVSKKIYLDKRVQEFSIAASKKPGFASVDVNNLLVKITEQEKSSQEYFYQYQHAAHFNERYEAAKYFNSNRQNEFATEIFNTALKDEAWPIIYLGLLNVKSANNSSEDHFKRIAELAQQHYHSLIRAEAVKVLKKYYPAKMTKEIHQQLKTDPSLLVKKALK
jgi:aminopeptidase N